MCLIINLWQHKIFYQKRRMTHLNFITLSHFHLRMDDSRIMVGELWSLIMYRFALQAFFIKGFRNKMCSFHFQETKLETDR